MENKPTVNIKRTKFITVNNYSVMDLTDVVAVTSNEFGNAIHFLFKNGIKHTESYEDFSALDWLEKIKKELGI